MTHTLGGRRTFVTFADPDDFAASIRGAQVELIITGRGNFAGKLTRIDFDRLWMQRFSDNLPRVVHSANLAARATFSFRIEPGPRLLAGGLEIFAGGLETQRW
jgi:hypothetical protein